MRNATFPVTYSATGSSADFGPALVRGVMADRVVRAGADSM